MIRDIGHLFSKSIRKCKFSSAWNWWACRAKTLLPFWVLAETLHTLRGETVLPWCCRGSKSLQVWSLMSSVCAPGKLWGCAVSHHLFCFPAEGIRSTSARRKTRLSLGVPLGCQWSRAVEAHVPQCWLECPEAQRLRLAGAASAGGSTLLPKVLAWCYCIPLTSASVQLGRVPRSFLQSKPISVPAPQLLLGSVCAECMISGHTAPRGWHKCSNYSSWGAHLSVSLFHSPFCSLIVV